MINKLILVGAIVSSVLDVSSAQGSFITINSLMFSVYQLHL